MYAPRNPFDWEETRKRRAEGKTSATMGNPDIRRGSKTAQSGMSSGAGQSRPRSLRYPRKQEDPRAKVPEGKLLDSVFLLKLRPPTENSIQSPKITGCEHVASYNWVDGQVASILVPGAPPAWTPLESPEQLKEDDGEYFRDINAARWPRRPMEPAIRALLEMQPDFATEDINIVTCATTIGNLDKFANHIYWNFDFEIQLVGSTLFMIRKEHPSKEIFRGIYGHGHTFPEAYTSWDPSVKGSLSHQRLVKYAFGGLKFIVRFESDGYLLDVADENEEPAMTKQAKKGDNGEDIDSLAQAMNTVDISTAPKPNGALEVKNAGFAIPHNAIFDLKTRSEKSVVNMNETIRRLWARQIPYFILAYHKRGLFENIRIEHVKEQIEEWEK
ncbi:hypothetical protein AJ80_06120 [Polytolypa hystricis UAMH7299]|uniref:Uncharacterized protein n=1 Tax=Polytolypa hystricis (strain UAMH7299) TaxID=1447883 RepID=A0A2B7XY73_POLH7|nr:hypothetical protein AJ80_06120 [Polytolypa hystricis UAMH7299]